MRVAIDIRRAGDYGLGTYIRNIVNQLARIDQTSKYLLIGRPQNLEQFDPLPVNFELLEHPYDFHSYRTHLQLPIILREREVDVLHMPWFYAPVVLSPRLVLTVHDLSDLLQRDAGTTPILQAGRLFLARRAAQRANHIFAVSHSTRRDVARTFNVPESKISVVYNAADEHFLNEPLPEDAERVLERHAVKWPYVLYAGNIRPQKNLPRLIEAFAVAKAELADHPEFAELKLLVIGEAPTRHAELRSAVVRARVREDVRFLGFVPQPVLRVFYSRAMAFLFPSLYEGFGLPPLEAMAHGTPVLTSNVSSLPEVFKDAALLVNPDNVFDIARGIRQILTENSLRDSLIQHGHARVRSFSWHEAAERVRAAYEKVLAANPEAQGLLAS
jgi:glycosyltransferase involved in cell wall biosynthesis